LAHISHAFSSLSLSSPRSPLFALGRRRGRRISRRFGYARTTDAIVTTNAIVATDAIVVTRAYEARFLDARRLVPSSRVVARVATSRDDATRRARRGDGVITTRG